MDEQSNKPDPDLVYGLFWGIFKPEIIRLALQLDVFSPLASGLATAEVVARACECEPSGMAALLDYLCSQKVLERQGGLYRLTPTAEMFLLPFSRAYVGEMILGYTDPAFFDSIRRALRSGQPISLEENFVQDAWLESYSAWRLEYSRELWAAAGVVPEPGRALRLLDLACGCAIKSLVLAQDSPDVHVTCLDAENVLAVARDLAQRLGVLSRVTFLPDDLNRADLGRDAYGAVLLGNVAHYLTEAQNRDLFQRVYATLMAGGVLVLDSPMEVGEPDESASFLTLMMWVNSGGRAYSFETYRAWLKEAGFVQVKQLSERWLAATKP